MKIRFALAALVLIALAGTKSFAQADEAYVKILPTSIPGVIKLHYALETTQPLEVRFYHDGELVASDRIKGGPFRTGVSKRYNVKNIENKDYWIEVESEQMTVTYHIMPSKDRKSFTSFLAKAQYNQPMVRANN